MLRMNGRFRHPKAEDCLVLKTDDYGIAVEEDVALKTEIVSSDENFFEELDLVLFPPMEKVLIEIFDKAKVPRLGGISSGRGWSTISTFQRCPYLWYRKYVQPLPPGIMPQGDREALAIGTLIHTFLAIYYTRMISPGYPLTPELVRDQALMKAKPEHVHESWRVFLNYALFYQREEIMPLAIEYNLQDPRTGESCRYDLIAYFPTTIGDRLAGTYNIEHKSTSRFDDASLDGWSNDGEILGQTMLWKRLGLHNKFGELRGTIVNLLGKQKEPQLHRTTIGPNSWQVGQHEKDLRVWGAQMQHAVATGNFPRARSGCIGRWGKCDLWDHCATGE